MRHSQQKSNRGNFLDWLTQRWVQTTGKSILLADHPWLRGPYGDVKSIGPDYFDTLVQQKVIRPRLPQKSPVGLLPSMALLNGPRFVAVQLHPAISRFYEETSAYSPDIWMQWSLLFRPFGRLLAAIFSRRLEQLNIPLTPLSTSRGLLSSITPFEDVKTGAFIYTGWIRQNRSSGETVFVGSYSTAKIPGHEAPCVKVVFPLPNGNATIFFRPSAQPDGTLVLESEGRSLGDPGFYFQVRKSESEAWVRYVRSFKERIHVFVDSQGELRTDHYFTFLGQQVLQLHYRLQRAG